MVHSFCFILFNKSEQLVEIPKPKRSSSHLDSYFIKSKKFKVSDTEKIVVLNNEQINPDLNKLFFPRLALLFSLFESPYVSKSSDTLEQLIRLLILLFSELSKIDIQNLAKVNLLPIENKTNEIISVIPVIPKSLLSSFINNINSDRCPERVFKLVQPMVTSIATQSINRCLFIICVI